MADPAPGVRPIKRQRLDEFDGLSACRPLTVRGLDGSEVQLPRQDNMTVEDLRKGVAGSIGLRLGGMLVFVAGGNTLHDAKQMLEQVQGNVITYVVQQVAHLHSCHVYLCSLTVGCQRILFSFVYRFTGPA